MMMRPAVRLCLGIVTTTVVFYAAATPAVVSNISHCMSSVCVMLHQAFAFQPRYFMMLNPFALDLSIETQAL
jgi:hypothetical protein